MGKMPVIVKGPFYKETNDDCPAQIMMVLSYEKLVEPPRVEHAQDSENGG